MQSHYDLLEPYITLRKVMFHVLNRQDCLPRHLLEFSTLARKVYVFVSRGDSFILETQEVQKGRDVSLVYNFHKS